MENFQMVVSFIALPHCVFVLAISTPLKLTLHLSHLLIGHQPAPAAPWTPSCPAWSGLHVSFRSPNSQWGARIHSRGLPCWQVFKLVLASILTCTLVKSLRGLLLGVFNKMFCTGVLQQLYNSWLWRELLSLRNQAVMVLLVQPLLLQSWAFFLFFLTDLQWNLTDQIKV